MERLIKLNLELTEGYEKRYAKAVANQYQVKANRERRTIGGVFTPNNERRRS